MRIESLIYTATRHVDFHVVCAPEMQGQTVELFTDVAKELAAIYTGGNPQWVLIRKGNFLLWGIVCENSVLSEVCRDAEGRMSRGFFGFVMDVEDGYAVSLPLDNSFFADIYERVVTPIWNDYVPNINHAVIDAESLSPSTSETSLPPRINRDQNLCRVFPDFVSVKELVTEVMNQTGDNSVLTNANPTTCAEPVPGFHFMNLISKTDTEQYDIKYAPKVDEQKDYTDDTNTEYTQDYFPVHEDDEGVNKDFKLEFCNLCGRPLTPDGRCHPCEKRRKRDKIKTLIMFAISLVALVFFIVEYFTNGFDRIKHLFN